MTVIDWIVVAVAALAALNGARRGFVAGLLGLVGFVGGAYLGARLAPWLLSSGSSSPWAPLFALAGALLLGFALSALLARVGETVLGGLRLPGLGAADAGLGAVLGAATALVLAWIAGAVALQTPGARELRSDVQNSAILSALNDVLPPSGPVLRALARFDPLPSISGPAPDRIEKPTPETLRQPGARAARDGTVRVLGVACGLGIVGSGWIAGTNTVVTNAHVVAGTGGELVVQLRGEGTRRRATALIYDARNDLAVLSVPGLGGTRLPLADEARAGTAAAILGYPRNGPYDARPARIGATRQVLSADSHGRGPLLRTMTSIRGLLRSGNSGGPVVDGDGRVLTTVFASSTSSSVDGGFGVPNSVVRSALERVQGARSSVSTGPCAA